MKKSKLKGVSWSKHNKKWKAQIRENGKVQHICYSDDEEYAGERYQEKLKQIKR